MTSFRFALVAVGVVALMGCSGSGPQLKNQHDAVKNRAQFDLDCKQIEVVDLGYRTFGATGCGRRATYLTEGGCGDTQFVGDTPCTAVMNSDEKKAERSTESAKAPEAAQ